MDHSRFPVIVFRVQAIEQLLHIVDAIGADVGNRTILGKTDW